MRYWINQHGYMVIEEEEGRRGSVLPLTQTEERLVREGRFQIGRGSIYFFGVEPTMETVTEEAFARYGALWKRAGWDASRCFED